MATDEDIDVFLEHWGVKGMKWGTRKSRDKSSRPTRRRTTGWEKVGWIGGGYITGGMAGTVVAVKILRKTGDVPLAAISSLATMGVAMYSIRKVPLKTRNKKLSTLKSMDQEAEIRKVEDFIKKNSSQ